MNPFQNIKTYFRPHRLPIIAIAILIIIKFFLINTLWHDRVLPPEPDDSLIYIANIESVRKCSTFVFCKELGFTFDNDSGFEHLSYRLLLGTVAKTFSISSQSVFQLSFYFGTIGLALILYFLLSRITNNNKLIAFQILIFSLYNGTGGYHGFFWVVPSFFAMALFMLILAFIIGEKKFNPILPGIVAIIYVYTHSIGIYLSLIYIIYTIFYCLLARKMDWRLIKKVILIMLFISISYGASSIYLSRLAVRKTYGIGSFSIAFGQTIRQNLSIDLGPSQEKPAPVSKSMVFDLSFLKDNMSVDIGNLVPGLYQIKENYLKFLFANPLIIGFLVLITWILWKNNQIKIIALYFAAFSFMLVSSINIYGYRSLLIIWPLTYLYFGFGLWYLFAYFAGKSHRFYRAIALIVLASIIVLFTIINLLFSVLINIDINRNNDYEITNITYEQIANKIEPQSRVYINPKALKILEAFNVIEGRNFGFYPTSALDASDYYIDLVNKSPVQVSPELNELYNFVAIMFNINRQTILPDERLELNNRFSRVDQFGDLILYKIQ